MSGARVVVVVAVRCGPGDDDLLRVILARFDGVVRWRDITPVGACEPDPARRRDMRLDAVFEFAGAPPVLVGDGDEEDVLPSWFYRVDIVELNEEVLAARSIGRMEGRAPLL